MDREKSAFAVIMAILVAIIIAQIVQLNNSNDSYMELLHITRSSEEQIAQSYTNEYLGVISDILEQEQLLLQLELTDEEIELLGKAYNNFQEAYSIEKANHYVGAMAYIVVQHNAVPNP